MPLYAFSDLHIQDANDPLYAKINAVLAREAAPGDTVVLAGDIFDLFVGDKKVFRDRYAGFLSALARAGARGVKLHYIEGNHDFLLARPFARVTGLRLHGSQASLEVGGGGGGRRFFFAHGDLVDSTDIGYRFMRFMFRSWLMRFAVWLLPGALIDRIGKGSSRWSRSSEVRLPSAWAPEDLERLRGRYRDYARARLAEGHDFVILGHCHDLDGEGGRYFNMGFPPAHGTFLYWDGRSETLMRRGF